MSFITSGFLDAMRTWNQYETGAREWGWGPYAAANYFTECGLGIPQRAPTEVEQVSLDTWSQMSEEARATPRGMRRLRTILRFLKDAFDVTQEALDAGPPNDAPASPLDTLRDAVTHYVEPPAPSLDFVAGQWVAATGIGCSLTDPAEYDHPPARPDGTTEPRTWDMNDQQIYDHAIGMNDDP